MEFENDVFISYAHIDNMSLSEEQKGWISHLHRALEVRLAQLLGKEARIFRDPKLQGNDDFGERLVKTLERTAALVSILTPRYVRSEWCTRELFEFVEHSRSTLGIRVGSKSRIFKIVKTPIPLDEHPQPVQDLLGYEFFSLDPETGRAIELDPELDTEARQRYWAKLNDLAYDLCELLGELGPGGATRSAAASPAAGSTVFLAQTSYDLREEREAVLRFLQQHGHTVLPDAPLPLVATDCAAALAEQLARCRMSVHLVGRHYGVVPEDTDQSLVALQHEAAVERAAAGDFERLIWLPPDLETEDERQQRLITALRTDPRVQRGADLLETPLPELELVIEERLQPPRKAVYLARATFDLRDEHDAMAKALERHGCQVLPDGPLPLHVEGCEEFLRHQLARCRMSIHLVGRRYGVVPEATSRSFTLLQYQLAAERAAADPGFTQLVWRPPELDPTDERQRRFLDLLREQGATVRGLEVLAGPFAELERAVADRLRPEAVPPTPEAAGEDGVRVVFLLCEARDQDATAELEDVLFERGFEVVLPIFEGDEAEIREEHEENMRRAAAVVLFWGAGGETWLRRMLREVKKSAGYGRSAPPPVTIWMAPPASPQKERLKTHEALVLRPGGGALGDDLEPFFRTLAEGAG